MSLIQFGILKKLVMAYTVQNAPWPLKVLFTIYGWILALLWFSFALIWRLTLRVRFEGLENLEGRPNSIYVFWHENLFMFFLAFLRIREPQIWLQHPLLFMKPIHIMLKLMGVKELAYGSSGNNGKAAMTRVEGKVKAGYSTIVTPDGPRGPLKKLKPGPILLSVNTGVPIVPMTYKCSNVWILNTWDSKILPKPFSRVVITYGQPVNVERQSLEEAIQEIEPLL
ncbi:MAG: lysophospholipid acyltransferase (LPLAT)-like uncharacterized protein [Granulosicoccus sp.]